MATALTSVGIQFSNNSTSTSNVIPSGVIAIWSGSIASIPSGWVLCDGSNSTPDLTDNFVVCAGDTYAVDATGGSADAVLVVHNHSGNTNTAAAHTHTIVHSHTGNVSANGSHTHTATISYDPHSHNHYITVDNGLTLLPHSHNHTAPGTSTSAGVHYHTGTTQPGGGHTHAPNAGGPTDFTQEMYFLAPKLQPSSFSPDPSAPFKLVLVPAPVAAFPYPSPDYSPLQPIPINAEDFSVFSAPNQNPDSGSLGFHGHPSSTTPGSPSWDNHPHSVTATSEAYEHTHSMNGFGTAPSGDHTHPSGSFVSNVSTAHSHTVSLTVDTASTDQFYANAGSHSHDVTIGAVVESTSSLTNANLPPYYALAFIMKT